MITSGDQERNGVWFRSIRMAAYIGGFATVAMMLHISIDVFMKFVFNAPLVGTLEIVSYYYMVPLVFLPLAFIDYVRQAITVDLFFGAFPAWLKVVAVLLTLCAMALAYGGYAYVSFMDGLAYMARNEVAMGSASVVIWPVRFVMAFGSALAALVCFVQFVQFVAGRDRASWLAAETKVEE